MAMSRNQIFIFLSFFFLQVVFFFGGFFFLHFSNGANKICETIHLFCLHTLECTLSNFVVLATISVSRPLMIYIKPPTYIVMALLPCKKKKKKVVVTENICLFNPGGL